MIVNFDKLKTEISLPDFLLKYGWKFAKGSSPSALKMTDGTQTLVIKKNSVGQYTYWNVHNDFVRGRSIIDFMQEQLFKETGKTPSLREVGVILQRFLEKGEIVLEEDSRYKISKATLDTDAIALLIQRIRPYTGSYLQDRGIELATLQTPHFSDTFYTYLYRKEDKVHENTCIKMINEKGLQGISQRATSFKGMIGAHYDAIAVSKHDPQRPIKGIYVGESMIDCVSHYQMKALNTADNILYISTEGSLTEGQMKLIKKLIEKNNVNEINTLFDNDRQGYIYTIKLSAFLKNNTLLDLGNTSAEALQSMITRIDNISIEMPKQKDWNEDLLSEHKKKTEEMSM